MESKSKIKNLKDKNLFVADGATIDGLPPNPNIGIGSEFWVGGGKSSNIVNYLLIPRLTKIGSYLFKIVNIGKYKIINIGRAIKIQPKQANIK